MRASYSTSEAKEKLYRCGMHFEGKQILGDSPGIKGWGAIDFLRKRGYSYFIAIRPERQIAKTPKSFVELVAVED